MRLNCFLYTFCFAASLSASSFGVGVNGTCETGNCPAVALAYNSSSTLDADFTVTLADGDKYLINGSFTGSNDSNGGGFTANHDFQVTYEGNPTGGTSKADTLNVQAYYAFQTTLAAVGEERGVYGAFGPTIASSSSGLSCLNGSVACLGPFSAPGDFNLSSASFALDSVNGAFIWDPTYTNNFGAGSAVGSYIVWGQTTPISPPAVPEPASLVLMGFGLVAIYLCRFRFSCNHP